MSPVDSLQQKGQLTAIDVDAHLRCAITEMHNAERSVFLWFCEVQRRSLYRDLGFSSIHAYASEKLGFSANRIGRYLRLMEDLKGLPRIHAALLKGQLGWTKARVIVRVAGPMNEGAWLKAALHMSRRELEAKILESRNVRGRGERQPQLMACRPSKRSSIPATRTPENVVFGSPDPELSDAGKTTLAFRLTAIELAGYEALLEKLYKQGRIKPGTPREEILLQALAALTESGESVPRGTATVNAHIHIQKDPSTGRAFCQTQRGPKRLRKAELEAVECDAVIDEPGKRNRSTIPPSIKAGVLARDGYKCQARGCHNTRFLELHHIVARKRGGTHDPKNLVTVCSHCHRLIHEGKLLVGQAK